MSDRVAGSATRFCFRGRHLFAIRALALATTSIAFREREVPRYPRRLILEKYATVHPFLEQDVPCATAEGLLILKLYALPSLYRQGDLQRANLDESDLAAVLLAKQLEMDPLFQELARYVSQTDLLELRKIVAELQARQKRFGNSPSNI